jgi:hypothetical protein
MLKDNFKYFSKEDIKTWGYEKKRCRECLNILDFDKFHKHRQCLFGINTVCKECRLPKSKRNYSLKTNEHLLFDGAKSRAKSKRLNFSLEIKDILIPDFCPVLGIPLSKGVGSSTDNTPTLDRIIPELGYTKENVVVISNKANRIKSNGNYQEIYKVARWLESIITIK